MVTRKLLLATVGWRSTSSSTWLRSKPAVSIGGSATGRRVTSRCIFGGLPSSTSIGMSTAGSPSPRSTTSCRSSVMRPTTAYGARSRRQIQSKAASCSGATASA